MKRNLNLSTNEAALLPVEHNDCEMDKLSEGPSVSFFSEPCISWDHDEQEVARMSGVYMITMASAESGIEAETQKTATLKASRTVASVTPTVTASLKATKRLIFQLDDRQHPISSADKVHEAPLYN